jgi:hypothetical protein
VPLLRKKNMIYEATASQTFVAKIQDKYFSLTAFIV